MIWYLIQGECLQFVQIVVEGRNALLQTFAFPNVSDNLEGFAGGVAGVSLENLPVVKHTLREGLASSIAAEVSGEP